MYSKRRKPNGMRTFLIVMIVACVCVLGGVIYFAANMQPMEFHWKLTVEAGEPWPQALEFIKNKETVSAADVGYLSDLSKVETTVPGTYDVQLSFRGKAVDVKVEVRDTVAPEGSVEDLVLYNPKELTIEDFKVVYSDVTAVTVTLESAPKPDEAGQKEAVILLTDAGGNVTRLTAKVSFLVDTTAPQIVGAKDIVTYVEDTVSYRNGVTVTDDQDPSAKLEIDNSGVNLSVPGEYQLVYKATDLAGNTATKTVKVTVYPKKADHVDLETIYAEADRILSQFITEDMTLREKAGAIYCWTKTHVQYSGKTDKSDWLQAAYKTMKTHKGDCYAFFSVNKLFLHRVGLTTIDVEKVKNDPDDTRHYWLLVSLDGGQTYYHYDNAWSPALCLVTDRELDAFSAAVDNCFNRDKSLYPATPTESLPPYELPWDDQRIINAK